MKESEMGFRSTFTTEDYNIQWPQWFREKYDKKIWFTEDYKGAKHPLERWVRVNSVHFC